MLAPSRTAVALLQASGFRAWVVEHEHEIFLSVITQAEIQAGISALTRKGATNRARHLQTWLDAILALHAGRLLPLTVEIGLQTGLFLDQAIGAGLDPGFEDAAIAATAKCHDLTVVTANMRHFEHFDVPLLEPHDL